MNNRDILKIIELFPQDIWSLAEVKNYLRIEANYDDQLISSLIDTAINIAENFTKLTVISKRLQLIINIKNQQKIQLKYQPVNKLLKIIMIIDEKELELSDKQYYLDQQKSILYWHEELLMGKLQIEYIAGFAKDNVPPAIKQAILMHVAEMYDQQKADSNFLSTEIKNLYLPYRFLRL